ncbi:MAG: alanine racemase [Saprospiraceae bacterium]|nr:alanine racemase [Saprospiraceae bacterium]
MIELLTKRRDKAPPLGYTISDIQHILSARFLQASDLNMRTEHLLIDSRQVVAPAVSLFFALKGKRHDGHQYIADLYNHGVRQFIVSKKIRLDGIPEANVLLVDDTLDALQNLAAYHRARFNIPVIGITGSNGKTVVKEWLWQVLAQDFNIVRSPKSYNSQVGVPLSIWQMNEHHTLAIFEAGISEPGEMERLERIIRPTIGVFTNLGPAHQEGFASEAHKLAEKMKLFGGVEWLICDKKYVSNNFSGRVIAPQPVTNTPMNTPWAAENAGLCRAVMQVLGIAAEDTEERLRRLEPVEMRLELKDGIQHCTLVNDFYNNDLASLRIALQFARQQARNGRLTLVLSDILQSGMPGADLWRLVAESIRANHVSRLIGIGQDIVKLQALLPDSLQAQFFPDTGSFLHQLQNTDFNEETILLKGARPFEFEKIARRLEQKAHKTVLEVNLSALVHNLNVYTRMLRPGAKMMVMVKAEGYGSGSAEVAKLLEFHRVDYFGVAYADEGIALRQAGIRLPILVLNPERTSFDAMYRYRLEPEVYCMSVLKELIEYAGHEKAMSIHLKIDTGMHRLGFDKNDIELLIALLKTYPNLQVQSVFSHLSAGDNHLHDAFTHQQASTFSEIYAAIQTAIGYAPLRHICNTGGIERFPEYHFDMVRLGIGLYGIGGANVQPDLRTVNVLKATVSQVKQVSAGDSVGYNRNSGILDHPVRIATISIGYADGFLRLAGGGRYEVLIRGQKAPTIGNVCMDMTMIDVSHIPDVQEGDEVMIFGDNPSVTALAACLQTIPYEVFTNISERVKRVYWQE